jgi:hypothetical protein
MKVVTLGWLESQVHRAPDHTLRYTTSATVAEYFFFQAAASISQLWAREREEPNHLSREMRHKAYSRISRHEKFVLFNYGSASRGGGALSLYILMRRKRLQRCDAVSFCFVVWRLINPRPLWWRDEDNHVQEEKDCAQKRGRQTMTYVFSALA